jgi:hypothetical protein
MELQHPAALRRFEVDDERRYKSNERPARASEFYRFSFAR